ncbi:hydroxysqualene dehydroxylase HpnE [Planctomicrobium sp. SH527]|uniref:hydroxysqualene dehydroxylase HpnE n=1 Tax=Planctomicrobium sp. SH527 TaxID=3448123 RepID=UPI003F5B2156
MPPHSSPSDRPTQAQSTDVVIVGGGLAGIAAAIGLSQAGIRVQLLESRPTLGGRSTSYVDKESSETIDNCQHVSMGCCTNLKSLCQRLGIADAFRTESTLYFIAPNGQCTPFAADPLPAPFHLTRAFLRLPYLTFREKRLFAFAVRALAKADSQDLSGTSFADWLRRHHQTDALIQNVWDVVLVSALSESLERIDASYARKVFVDGFLRHASGWQVEIPTIDLDELYSVRTRHALEQAGVSVSVQSRVAKLNLSQNLSQNTISTVELSDGSTIAADHVILAVPQHQIDNLLPEDAIFDDLRSRALRMETAPITSVHLWYDRPVTTLPHAVLVGRLGQWLFNRGERIIHGKPAWYYQVVISASRQLKAQSQEQVVASLDQELQEIWPQSEQPSRSNTKAEILHSRVITERRAVFSVTPGIDELRPLQQTAIGNMQIAGDWTQTGWPATMEGAVISGYLAAENILAKLGRPQKLVAPGLPTSFGARLLLGIKSP